ncbi:MAG: MgtC/SapB family protein [Ruminococcaceae bacterium]|nr:MgtC/SapB family protein [Oscillospiraceae bacterium]
MQFLSEAIDFLSKIMDYLREFNWISVLVRVLLTMVFGGIIGIGRERKRRPAGFRTHMLVCLGSAMTMMVNQYLIDKGYTVDASRLGAQVISGIGFLGAGTIIVTGHRQVNGLTTAAGLWASACMGLAIGAGFYEGALLACIVILLTTTLFTYFDRKVRSSSRVMWVTVEFFHSEDFPAILDNLRGMELRVFNIELNKSRSEAGMHSATLSVEMQKKHSHDEVLALIATVDGVGAVEEL